jgi:hypothetical protein
MCKKKEELFYLDWTFNFKRRRRAIVKFYDTSGTFAK